MPQVPTWMGVAATYGMSPQLKRKVSIKQGLARLVFQFPGAFLKGAGRREGEGVAIMPGAHSNEFLMNVGEYWYKVTVTSADRPLYVEAEEKTK